MWVVSKGMTNELPPLTLVVGAAASGKSVFAEGLVTQSGQRPVYVATAQVFDGETRDKIDLHIARRGPEWRTIEAPFDLMPALGGVTAGDAVLLDCLTMWLTNVILAEQDLTAAEERLVSALDHSDAPLVLVSNEVGAGIVPDNALARRFREAQGRLNQRLAARADAVVTVIAGLPMWLKRP